ncbi:DUF465 domain-containing protein [bacterium]|nr:DUF465 domain-containing protein [bacterium]
MNDVDVKEYLIQNDQEFRQLVQRHQSYESQLEALKDRSFLNEQEKFEETVIKKKKLALKDQMQVRIHDYQVGHAQD